MKRAEKDSQEFYHLIVEARIKRGRKIEEKETNWIRKENRNEHKTDSEQFLYIFG